MPSVMRFKPLLALCFILISLTFAATPVWALNAQWTGNVDSDWSNTGNWFNGDVPSDGDNVTISTGVYTPVFTSANGQLTFEYKNDWICNEVVTGARVDCYPSSRNSELEDHGLDMPTVYYPDITIFISNCSASLTDMDAAHSYKFVQDLNGCKVLVLALETTFSSEEEAKTVFASSDETEEIIQKISEYCEEHNMPECPPTISHSVVDLGDEYSVVKVGSFNYLLTKKDNEWNVSIVSQEDDICDTGSDSPDLAEYCNL